MGQEGFKLDWSWVALLFSHKKRPRRSGAKLRLLWANLGGCGLQWVSCLRQRVPLLIKGPCLYKRSQLGILAAARILGATLATTQAHYHHHYPHLLL